MPSAPGLRRLRPKKADGCGRSASRARRCRTPSHSTARWLAVGSAAARGLRGAIAAGAGFPSDVKIPDGDFLKNIYGVTPNAALLGGGWDTLGLSQTSFKPWCAARQTMAATQALKEILA